MLTLQGVPLPALPLGDPQWLSDLEYFDGPIVSHYRHEKGDHFLRYWVDCDAGVNRWMWARVSETDVISLSNRIESLDNVIPGRCLDVFVYFSDVGRANQQVVMTDVESIPEEYTPRSGAFLTPDESAEESKSIPILLYEGLSFEDMTMIPRSFRQAYYLLYLLRKSTRPDFTSHPWRGGFSSMHFYREVPDWIPKEAKAEVTQYQYASPGFIRFSVDRPTADFLCRSVERVDKAKYGISQAFTNLGSYIQQNKLNKLPRQNPAWAKQHDKKLISLTKELLRALEIDEPDELIRSAPRPFEAAKIARSLVNRLRRLSHYQRDHLIRLPQTDES